MIRDAALKAVDEDERYLQVRARAVAIGMHRTHTRWYHGLHLDEGNWGAVLVLNDEPPYGWFYKGGFDEQGRDWFKDETDALEIALLRRDVVLS